MARSGQVTVTTAGTAVRGPDVKARKIALIAPSANTGVVYAGDDAAGDVSATTGIVLSETSYLYLRVSNLNDLWFDAATNGDKVHWITVD